MLVYPFDPQCRLDSNVIQDDALLAYPSSATRTLVPAHAPFFQEGCVVKKNGKELVEGIDFYFSLEHKVATFATALRVYGGITLINDGISPPLTMSYHAQGGSFEATPGQIRQYLDTAPDIWDGSWEALLGNTYYPPVKILYDPEAFVSEPAIIEACHTITDAIKAKDEKETISYQTYAIRVAKVKEDLERLDMDEHVLKKGNIHNTKPSDVGALGKDEVAANTKRLEGKDLAAFAAYVTSVVGDLAEAMADKAKVGEDLIVQEKFLLDGGTLELGESTSLTMDEDGISIIGDNAFVIKADSRCIRPGTKATLYGGGGNVLAVESTGNAKDDRKLTVNDKEIVTLATLRAYVNSILSQTGYNFTQQQTSTMYFTGAGTMQSPIEAVPTIPVATETAHGVVKVVNEGSHGFPCPGYGGQNFYAWHYADNEYRVLRNGADDLESDIFINTLVSSPFKFTPTADRFRPAGLPITAKPTYISHGTPDCVWLNTTDGPFILLTGRNPDHHTWRCLKITNSGFEFGYYGCPFLVGNKLYCVRSVMQPSSSWVQLYEATVGAGNTVTFTQRTLTGNNNNGTPQNGLTFSLFDKMVGGPGEKAYVVNVDGFYTGISVSHAGDQFDHVQQGKLVRFNHNGWFWAGNTVTATSSWNSMSYVLDLETGVVTPDAPEIYPLKLTASGLTPISMPPLRCTGGNHTINGVRTADNNVLAFQSFGRLYTPQLFFMVNNGVDNFENARWNQQKFQMPGAATFLGAYAGPVHSGIRGVFPLSGNRMIGLCMDGFRVRFQYDPNGSYGPKAKGYGPTNNRMQITDNTLHESLAKMTWYFDGDVTKQAGTLLADNRLSNNSTYENDIVGTPVSISAAAHQALKQQAINKYAAQYASGITDSKLTLGIHRAPGVPMLGMLQILHPMPGGTAGRMQFDVYVFEITVSNTTGQISSVGLGAQRTTWVHNNTANRFVPEWDKFYYSNSAVFRLKDGGHIVMLGGEGGVWVGNGGSPSIAALYNAAGEYVSQLITSVNTVTGEAWVGTKELGFGLTSISDSGEGLYLNSYGNTVAEIHGCILGQRPTEKFILVLSRSDAGDNVAISQYAASATRDKVQSLIPPARRVQGMDLSADRTVTKAMLANADRIPNQRDAAYPVQQKHRDSLSAVSPLNHQHGAGDFTMAAATLSAHGAGVLGDLSGSATSAASVAVLDVLETATDTLFQRTVTQVKLDNSMTIDYEV